MTPRPRRSSSRSGSVGASGSRSPGWSPSCPGHPGAGPAHRGSPQDPASQFVNDPGRPAEHRPGSAPTSWVATCLPQVIWGARISLVVGFAAIAFGLLVGGTLGILAGFLAGFDRVISFVFVVMLSFPALVLAILITSLDRKLSGSRDARHPVDRSRRPARPGAHPRVRRAGVRHGRPLVGAKSGRIIVREILPNVLIPMGALALLGMAVAIVAEGGLAFLGLTVRPRRPRRWGNMSSRPRSGIDLEDSPWLAFCAISSCSSPSWRSTSPATGCASTIDVKRSRCDPGDIGRPTRPVRVARGPNLRTAFKTERGRPGPSTACSFTLEQGQTLGIVGESGSGKTVLSRSIMG